MTPVEQPTATRAEQLTTFAACVFDEADVVEVRLLPAKRSYWPKAGELPKLAGKLASANARGENIYAGANPRTKSGGTKTSDVGLARCLFVDVDGGATPDEAQERWQTAGLPRPTLTLASGHGVHCYWRLTEPITDLAYWSELQRRLIAVLDSDTSVHDPPRIMRLPGFANLKRDPLVPCVIVAADPGLRYPLATLESVIGNTARRPASNGVPAAIAAPSGINVFARAAAYIAKLPTSSEGGRNLAAIRVAAVLVKDFALSEDEALPLLSRWNAGNNPPLDETELRTVLANAGKYGTHTVGNKLHSLASNNRPQASDGRDVDVPDMADPWPEPLDEAAFHGVAGELVRAIEPHSEADPVALLASILVAFGNVIGRTAHFRAEADLHYGNLFTCLVGSTSKGRKGISWGQAARVFGTVDPDWLNNHVVGGLSSGEGLIWAVRDAIYRHEAVREGKGKSARVVDYQDVEVDPGVVDKRLLVLESEFSSVLKVILRERNTLSAIIRQAWDRGNLATLTKNSPAKATGAHISIIGHITRNELKRLITETDLANGLANRFLWLCVRRSKCLPEGGAIHTVDFRAIDSRLSNAVAFAGHTDILQRDPEAREVWRQVYPRLSEGQPGLLGAATSRAEAQVMRLAMLYSLLDCSPLIQPDHLLAALAVWRYAEQSARYVFGSALGDPTADAILQTLRNSPDGLTREEIRKLFSGNRPAEEIARALAVLVEAGLARREPRDTGGRPAEVWFHIG